MYSCCSRARPHRPQEYKGGACNLESIFTGQVLGNTGYCFRPSPEQRPYEWTRTQVGKFADTLLSAYQRQPADANKATLYQVGHATLWREDASSKDYAIVDGQHRLLTLTMVNSVMRHIFSTKGYGLPSNIKIAELLGDHDDNDAYFVRVSTKPGRCCGTNCSQSLLWTSIHKRQNLRLT